jgi:DNA-directed RNA polymerase subunit RPC12/RpoP
VEKDSTNHLIDSADNKACQWVVEFMTSTEDSQSLVQYRCEVCNAPYPLGADDVISTCPYCGHTFVVDGGEIKTHLLLSNRLEKEGVEEVVTDWLQFAASKSVGKGVMKDIELGEPVLQWIPMFRVKASTQTYHFGAEQEGSGDNKRWVKVEGRDSAKITEWVLARRYAATFGIQEFIESLEDKEAKNFDISLTNKAQVLNAEIADTDASVRAKHLKSEKDRAELNEKMEKLFDYRLDMETDDCSYVHVPYWLIRYEYRGGTFRVAVSGASGKVVLGELPVTKTYRVKKWFSSLFMLVAGALLLQGTPYITIAILTADSSDGEVFLIPVVMFILGIVLWLGSIQVMGSVLKYEIQLTADGEEREEGFSFGDSLKGVGGRFT